MNTEDFRATELLLDVADLLRDAEILRDEVLDQHEYVDLVNDPAKRYSKPQFIDLAREVLNTATGDKEKLLAKGAKLRTRCEEWLAEKTTDIDNFDNLFCAEDTDAMCDGPYYEASYQLLTEELQRTKQALKKLQEVTNLLNDINTNVPV